ncbi:type II toxin-antitoxin system RelE/ParE family toxin [Mucilaginibacter sp.]|uniref:type II toxin-antitoxin system RelE family toxin n=1 Tax=Mucilaginibacter sp. TaxID=1882438 RepID=UPI00344B1198
MIVRIDKSFQKDTSKINDAKTKAAIVEVINNIQAATDISAINKLKKIVGYKNMYRIRLGDFRIGLEYTESNEIILIRFLHRKEIYKRWP